MTKDGDGPRVEARNPRYMMAVVGEVMLDHARHPGMWEILVPLSEAYLNLAKADAFDKGRVING